MSVYGSRFEGFRLEGCQGEGFGVEGFTVQGFGLRIDSYMEPLIGYRVNWQQIRISRMGVCMRVYEDIFQNLYQ